MTIRVLLAEDDEDHLFLAVRALRDTAGPAIEVETVRDGQEALDYVRRRGRFKDRLLPQLIVLDLKMPKVHGLKVLEEIKNDPELKRIPIVVLSSSDRIEDVDATYRLGGNSYVTKAGGRETLRSLATFWTETAELPVIPG